MNENTNFNDMLTANWNDGKLQTSYYGTAMEQQGAFCGITWHGGIDLLVPRKVNGFDPNFRPVTTPARQLIREMKTGKKAVCYFGKERINIMFDDDSDYPYCVGLETRQMVSLPSKNDDGKTGEIRVWSYDMAKGKMFKALTLKCEFVDNDKENVAD